MVFISQVRNERWWQLNEFLKLMWGAERVSNLGHPVWAQEVRKMPAPGKMQLNSAAAHVKVWVNQICPWNKRLPTIASRPNAELDLFGSQVFKIFTSVVNIWNPYFGLSKSGSAHLLEQGDGCLYVLSFSALSISPPCLSPSPTGFFP